VTQLRTAVVTGASAGIGKATAVALARMGWRVIGVGRDRHGRRYRGDVRGEPPRAFPADA
jgi:NAD(P)-dependent dehydrogenase (short-subunit alcohol dehydrogenase family)